MVSAEREPITGAFLNLSLNQFFAKQNFSADIRGQTFGGMTSGALDIRQWLCNVSNSADVARSNSAVLVQHPHQIAPEDFVT